MSRGEVVISDSQLLKLRSSLLHRQSFSKISKWWMAGKVMVKKRKKKVVYGI